MTSGEKSTHDRESYLPDGPDWIEFLDFIDDCKFHYTQVLDLTRRDFLYRYFARHSVKFECGTHRHQFYADQRHEGDVYIASPDTTIDPNTCWWLKMQELDRQLLSDDPHARAAYLSQPEHAYLARMAALRLAVQTGHPPPHNLTFSDFQNIWVEGPSRRHALRLLAKSEPHALANAPDEAVAVVANVKQDLPPPQPQWLTPTSSPRVIRTNTDVWQDHGFHRLMILRHDAKKILGMINNIRSCSSPPITGEEIALGVLGCKHCQNNERSYAVSPPGVYYAPPGAGKSTALTEGYFVGIDTDWLLHSSHYSVMIQPFVAENIPVLTNQYHLACHSGERFFGYFNPAILRLNPQGIPYTPLSEIKAAESTLRSDLFLIYGNKYLSDALPILFRAAYLYNRSRIRFMSKTEQPLSSTRPYRSSHGHRSVEDFVQIVKGWSKSRKQKRREKLASLLDTSHPT